MQKPKSLMILLLYIGITKSKINREIFIFTTDRQVVMLNADESGLSNTNVASLDLSEILIRKKDRLEDLSKQVEPKRFKELVN